MEERISNSSDEIEVREVELVLEEVKEEYKIPLTLSYPVTLLLNPSNSFLPLLTPFLLLGLGFLPYSNSILLLTLFLLHITPNPVLTPSYS